MEKSRSKKKPFGTLIARIGKIIRETVKVKRIAAFRSIAVFGVLFALLTVAVFIVSESPLEKRGDLLRGPDLLTPIGVGQVFGQVSREGFSDPPTNITPDSEKRFDDRKGTMWAPYLEWSLKNPKYRGNPFDVVAEVVFTHEESGELRRTEMFYGGDNIWKFRFSGSRTGRWTFITSSSDPDLHGYTGRISIFPNPNRNIKGFLLSSGSKFAVQVEENGEAEGVLFNILGGGDFPSGVNAWYNSTNLTADLNDIVENYIRAHGMNVLYSGAICNRWFNLETRSWDEHESENPDLRTFEALEKAIVYLHSQGVYLHIWAWGDEQRKFTPIGVGVIKILPEKRPFRRIQRYLNAWFGRGGINGVTDKRLQRYIAARLGPLAGWSMSYGFDLEEWVSEEQVGEWAGYLKEHMGWPHLLMARGRTHPNLDVRSISHYGGPEKLPKSYNDVVMDMQYDKSRPHIYEERFLHGRWDYFTMDVTRRHMWWYAMAGGMGGFWGPMWDDGAQYPNPEQMRTHKRFWDGRFLLEMQRTESLTDGYALKTPDGRRLVFYREDAESITMDLSSIPHGLSALAVDAKKEYREIELGTLEPGKHFIPLPYFSDWAVAVGIQLHSRFPE